MSWARPRDWGRCPSTFPWDDGPAGIFAKKKQGRGAQPAARSLLISADVSQRPPPIFWTSL